MKNNHKHELNSALLRATPARLAILDFLKKTDKPVDVWDIVNYLGEQKIDTDPATAFRIINIFTEKGLTKKIQFNDRKFRYELTSKPEHHHLVCNSCGRVEDIYDCGVQKLEKEILEKKKFIVKYHSLEFFGICADCQK
jgi:Fe2+ or Zn2+ uptake regulation protein